MTAEPRPVEEIRALHGLHGSSGCKAILRGDELGDFYECSCGWRSDTGTGVAIARDRLAAADRENAELRGLLSRVARSAVRYDQRVYRLTDDFAALAPFLSEDDIAAAGERPSETDARVETERDDLRAQLAAAQAQLAEARAANGLLRTQVSALDRVYVRTQNERNDAQARLRAVNDEATYDDVYTELSLALGTDDTADEDVDFKRDLTARIISHFAAALSAAPQPEPVQCPCATPGGALYLDNLRRLSPSRRTIAAAEAACTCGQHRLTWPEPPASDEPARCEHGFTAWHWIGGHYSTGRWSDPPESCPGPTASPR